jgi:hypothetical protein
MVETVEIHQEIWFVMLESTKGQVLGVDTSRQHVPPHVWYGIACLLMKVVICCESCSVVWGKM